MRSAAGILLSSLCLIGSALAQQPPSDQSPPQSPPQAQAPPPNQQPPESKQEAKSDQEKSREHSAEAGESSSRDTWIDISPPKDDLKDHPNSAVGLRESTEYAGDVQELHPWDPYRALKDDEVGDFYFKQKDYKAALARYQDALIYKNNDAVANFRLAQCYEKMGQPEQAIPHYQEYLKILPQGLFAKDAKKALAKLGAPEKQISQKAAPK